jgi:Kef-type K+ transport system membrane component KefB
MQLLPTEWNSFLSDGLALLPDLPALTDLPRAAWIGCALLLAVWLGDRLQRTGAARTTGYWLCGALFGIALVGVQMWLVLPAPTPGVNGTAFSSLAQGVPSTWAALQSLAWIFDLALGWVLVELGQRMDLRWLLRNRALAATAVLEYALTWGLAALVLTSLGLAWLPAAVAATLAAHSSPVLLSTLLAQWRSEGQVTERALHLGSINTVLSAITLPAVLALGSAYAQGTSAQAHAAVLGATVGGTVNASVLRSGLELAQPIWEVVSSVAIGFGLGALLSRLRPGTPGASVNRATGLLGVPANGNLSLPLSPAAPERAQWLSLLGAVCVAVGLAQWWGAPALVACLALGLSLRRRAAHALLADLPGSGAGLGQLAQVLMFLVAGACLPWWQWAGLQPQVNGSALSVQVLALAALLLLVRLFAKTLVCTLTARWAGLRWVQGLALGLMLQPLSMTGLVFAAMAASALASTYPPLAHAVLLMLCLSDVLAPWLMRSVLRGMREVAPAPVQPISLRSYHSGLHTQSSLLPRRVDTHSDIQAVG